MNNLFAGFTSGLPASGMVTFTNPLTGSSIISVDGVDYTFGLDFFGDTLNHVAESFTALINADTTKQHLQGSRKYIKSVYAIQYGPAVVLVAAIPGTAGNSITLAKTLAAGATLSGATLTGGTTISVGGDATAANQATEIAAIGATTDVAVASDSNGSLSAKLRGLVKILADVWDSVNHRVRVDGSGVTQPVSAATLPLPTGASTAALQIAANVTLTSINGNTSITASNVSDLFGASSSTADATNALATSLVKAITYSAAKTGLVPAAAATDIFEILGAVGPVVTVLRLCVTGTATAAGAYDFQLIKRSAADTAGTSTTITSIPHQTLDAAAGGVVKAYTANPTLGAGIGTIRSLKGTVSTVAGAIPIVPTIFEFGLTQQKGLILANGESLALSLNGATITGGSLNVEVTWIEV